MKNLIAALIKFQKQVPAIPKNNINPFFSQGGKKAMYADLPTVIDVCLPVLNDNGLCVVQVLNAREGKNLLVTILMHESGEQLESHIYLPDISDPQKVTAAITYLRRAGYLAILGLVAEDEQDGNGLPGTQSEKPNNQSYNKPTTQINNGTPASPAQIGAMRKLGIEFSDNVTKQEAMKLLGDFNKNK